MKESHVHVDVFFFILLFVSTLCLSACLVDYILQIVKWGDFFGEKLVVLILFMFVTYYFYHHASKGSGGDR